MATVRDAVRAGVLEEFRLPEWEARPPVRNLFVAQDYWDWSDAKTEMHDTSKMKGGRTFAEHVDQGFADMRCSARPSGGDLHRIEPNRDGIWKLTVPGVRIFGWFHARGEFIAVAGELKSALHDHPSLHDAKREEVLGFCNRHALAGTIIVGDHRAVL